MVENSGSTAFHARDALLPGGWAENVRIEVNADGLISRIESDTDAQTGDVLESLLIPGAVNVHSHAFQRMIVGRSERFDSPDDDFWAWRTLMYKAVRELTPDGLYDCALALYRDMRAAGTTTVCEFHYTHHLYRGTPSDSADAVARAARDAGIRQTLLPVLYRYGGFGRREPSEAQRAFVLRPEACLDLIETLRSREDSRRFRVGYAPHSLRAVDHDDLNGLLEHRAATDPIAPFHIHVSEQLREVHEAVLSLGSRPVAWLYDRYGPDAGWCLVHATHIDDRELSLLASSEATVALCPTTEANLGDGVFPLGEFLRAGGMFGLGSDSNLTVSNAEEIRLLDFQNRLLSRRRNAFSFTADDGVPARPASRLWRTSLRGANRVTGLPVGAIEIGCGADFVSLSVDHPRSVDRTADDVLATFVYSAGTEMIERVYVGGRAETH